MTAKTNLSRNFVFIVIMMAVVPQAFNLFYAATFVTIRPNKPLINVSKIDDRAFNKLFFVLYS